MRIPARVEAALSSHPAPLRAQLMRLRTLILDTAAGTGAGEIDETLKWGQPAYLAKGGSTIRIGAAKDGGAALYFICHTDLVATFRELYPRLAYEGNRAILLGTRAKLPQKALRHCIAGAEVQALNLVLRSIFPTTVIPVERSERRDPSRTCCDRSRLCAMLAHRLA